MVEDLSQYQLGVGLGPGCTCWTSVVYLVTDHVNLLITRVSVRYGEIFHEPKASEISRHILQLTSVISALFL